jgi:hypothetical protein
MSEREGGSASAAQGELRLALVAALVFLAPLALAEPVLARVLLAWAGVLVVYVALLRLFGLRSVLEVAIFVFLLSMCVAGVLWLDARPARQAEPSAPAAQSGPPEQRTSRTEWMRGPADDGASSRSRATIAR